MDVPNFNELRRASDQIAHATTRHDLIRAGAVYSGAILREFARQEKRLPSAAERHAVTVAVMKELLPAAGAGAQPTSRRQAPAGAFSPAEIVKAFETLAKAATTDQERLDLATKRLEFLRATNL